MRAGDLVTVTDISGHGIWWLTAVAAIGPPGTLLPWWWLKPADEAARAQAQSLMRHESSLRLLVHVRLLASSHKHRHRRHHV